MKPPQRKRNAPEKLDLHTPGSKHDLISARVRKIADRKKKREIKRNQRVKTEDGDLGNDQVDTEETILYMSKLVFLVGQQEKGFQEEQVVQECQEDQVEEVLQVEKVTKNEPGAGVETSGRKK